jgi:hypothetical protein
VVSEDAAYVMPVLAGHADVVVVRFGGAEIDAKVSAFGVR